MFIDNYKKIKIQQKLNTFLTGFVRDAKETHHNLTV